MKLEVGMYVRTPYGIDKIKDIVLNGNLYEDSGLYLEKGIKLVCGKEEMKNLKSSHNIIDLIEVGDYVNGKKVERIDKDPFIKGQVNLWTNDIISNYWGDISLSPVRDKEVKSIVTKEQFESMSYKVGD